MATGLMKLPENRVRRNYTGGAGIDRLHGKARQEDNNMPEEWVGSWWKPPIREWNPLHTKDWAGGGDRGWPQVSADIIDDDREFYLRRRQGGGLAPQLPA